MKVGMKTPSLSEEPESSEHEAEASRTKADASVRRVKDCPAESVCLPEAGG